nr:pentapeptide repeat-containing protein [Microcoleaceae cyanobacterium MO_207.B10]
NLSGANLSGANLSGANLSGANLSDAYLKNADFTKYGVDTGQSEIDYVKVKNLTPEQVKSGCYWQEANFDQEFLEKLKAYPDPEEKPDCSIWENESY